MLKKLTILLFVAIFITNISSADSTRYKWDTGSKKIFTSFNQQTVKDVLVKFCDINNCQLSLSGDTAYLQKNINGNYTFNNYSEYLNFLSDKFNFNWFYYKGTLYVSSEDYDFGILPVPPEYLDQLKDNVISAGLFNPKFGWTINTQNSTIVVSGPVKYVQLIKNFVNNFTPLPKGNDFIVVKLKYANANDLNLNLNGQAYVIPGITTILNNLTNPYIMQQNQEAFQNTSQSTMLLKNTVSSYKNDPAVKSILGDMGKEDAATNKVGGQSVLDTFPIIQSDVRNNSVVVFDKRANLAMYAKLIKLLDVAQRMLQVNTTVIDINEDTFNSNGINWLAGINGTQIGYNTNNIANTTNALSASNSNAQSLLSGNVLNSFILNINELSQTGNAKIQSTPSVITLNDFPAIITFNSQLFYMQAGGNGSGTTNGAANSSPSQVNANSVIVITPHIMSNQQIRLEIMLQSQQLFDQDNTSAFPILNGGTIQTQAVLSPSQGLVLGGYDQEKKVNFISKVPVLGDIPLLGWFFKSQVIKTIRTKRAYLITISLINPDLQPNATTNPDTQQSVTTNPGTQPNATTNPGTQPNATTNPGTQPNATTNPGTQPTVTTNPGIQPTVTINPGTQQNAAKNPATQPNATTNPGIQQNVTKTPDMQQNVTKQ